MKEKPLKRNKYLVPISREHHFGLLFCWKIRQGLKRSVDTGRITRYVKSFWSKNLHPHFKEEETLLFLDKSDTLIQQAFEEHLLIEAQIQEIIDTAERATAEELNMLTDNLDKHIRFEERVLFPHLQKKFSELELQNIDACLQDASSVLLRDNYPDEFWRDPNSSL